MISDELTIWGYIKIPYPYLDDFQLAVSEEKGKNNYKDFADFIMPPITTIGNAMVTFGYIFRYEDQDEIEMVKRFESFLKQFKFLSAIVQVEIENRECLINEYVFNGERIYKSERIIDISKNQEPVAIS